MHPHESEWPDYLPGPRDDIFALGVVCLNYSQLESMLRHVFSAVTRLNEIQTSALFHRLPNNIRQDALIEMMGQTTLPEKLKERVRYFCKGFKVCAENRHDLMHSRSGGVYTSRSSNTRGILFTKYSKAGRKLVCPASLSTLRSVADDIHALANFGAAVCSDIRGLLVCRDRGDEESFWRIPLRDKPHPPSPLNWRAEKDALERPPPPESSRG